MDSNISTAIFSLFALIAIAVASERKSVVFDPFLLKSNDAEAAGNEEHLRYKRADVRRIRHLYNESRVIPFTDAEKQAILDKHLELRSSVNPEASNMEYMIWNDDLATLAELWTSVCYWGHGFTDHLDIILNFPSIGQNLWLGGHKSDGVFPVEAWYYDEMDSYDYDAIQCTGPYPCGHYTQVVWGTSKELGCGRAYCMNTIDLDGNPVGRNSDVYMVACHYSPAGNYRGVRPYINGTSCSECPSDSPVCCNKMCASTLPCPDIIRRVDSGQISTQVTYSVCGTPTIIYNPPSGSTFNAGATQIVSVTGADANGVQITCAFSVQVLAVGIVCPIIRNPSSSSQVSFDNPTLSNFENPDSVTVTYSYGGQTQQIAASQQTHTLDSFNFATGNNTISVSASDGANTAVCSFTYTRDGSESTSTSFPPSTSTMSKTTTDIDDCNPNPCQNGGSCSDGVDSYTCSCTDGYTGTTCNTNIDDCNPNPCQNEGSCSDGVGSYTCSCTDGYTGTTCNTNIDDCIPNPCQNGGRCSDGVDSYTCSCTDGYTGTTCNTNIDDCNPNPCQNGGSCSDGVDSYTCSCTDGYTGTTCNTNIDDCNPNPCQNGGSCSDGVDSYTCSCTDGYTGTTCNTTENLTDGSESTSTSLPESTSTMSKTTTAENPTDGSESTSTSFPQSTFTMSKTTTTTTAENPTDGSESTSTSFPQSTSTMSKTTTTTTAENRTDVSESTFPQSTPTMSKTTTAENPTDGSESTSTSFPERTSTMSKTTTTTAENPTDGSESTRTSFPESTSTMSNTITTTAENTTDASESTGTSFPESTSTMSNTTTTADWQDKSSGLKRMGAAGIVTFCLIIAILVVK
ncbi:uncharacterized protein [Amphiura filiformis]|uniref:uncharacterized protein n=1 Tax=Amphiura filiformis TaxID=82378 RepID=UPI003B20C501